MKRKPEYYRARIKALTETTGSSTVDENHKFFRNGFVPKNAQSTITKRIKHFISDASKEPLTFEEITSFSTWFNIHPEKIAGKEEPTTNRIFPIKTKGTTADIKKMFANVFGNDNSNESEAEAMAIALQLELELISLNSKTMNYVSSLSGTNGLGALPKDMSNLISQNKRSIDKILKKANKLNG